MEHFLELLGTIVGVIYLWLEYKASIHLWIVSIIMPIIYLFIFYDAGLYADFGVNIYYLLIAIYGWIMWKYGKSKSKETQATEETVSTELPITHMPIRKWPSTMAIFIIIFIGIALILKEFTDSNVPWLDAFTTALSIVGMWMLAQKYIEQWWTWMIVDVVSVGLYIYKDLYFTAALYALYALIALFGYRKWKQLMQEDQPQHRQNE